MDFPGRLYPDKQFRIIAAILIMFLLIAVIFIGKSLCGPAGKGSGEQKVGKNGEELIEKETTRVLVGDKTKRDNVHESRIKPAVKNNTFSKDKIPPKIEHRVLNSIIANGRTVAGRAKLALKAIDSGSGLDAIYWHSSETNVWRRYRRPILLARAARRKKGSIYFRARDRAGNMTRVSRFQFQIDDKAPEFPPELIRQIIAQRGKSKLITKQGILIPAYEKNARLEYRFNRNPFHRLKKGDTVRPNGDGIYSLTFRITDQFGNSRLRVFKIKSDNTPPRTTIQYRG